MDDLGLQEGWSLSLARGWGVLWDGEQWEIEIGVGCASLWGMEVGSASYPLRLPFSLMSSSTISSPKNSHKNYISEDVGKAMQFLLKKINRKYLTSSIGILGIFRVSEGPWVEKTTLNRTLHKSNDLVYFLQMLKL